MTDWIHDLRYSVRALAKRPGFSLVAVATLAVAVGANTAIFTVLHAVVLRGLPYEDAARLGVVWVDFGEQGQSLPAISSLDFRDYQRMATRFEGFAAASSTKVNLTGAGDPEVAVLGLATYNLFSLLGVSPALGRGFLEEEDVLNGPDVVLLSDGLWRRRFGADPGVVGSTVEVNGTAREVIGVLPPGFALHLPAEAMVERPVLWAPLQDPFLGPRNRTLLTAVARLRRGVSFEQAQEEMAAIALRLREEHLVHRQSDTRVRLVPLHQDVVKSVRPALLALFGAVGLVLLIACGTVANLVLARGAARNRELAIRVSFGASRGRLVRQLLTESALLSVVAGLSGMLLAAWGTRALLALQPTHLPRVDTISMGGPAFAFAAGTSLLTVLLFGLVPSLRLSTPQLYGSLREGGRTLAATTRESLRSVFVASEVALALVLLVGVSLLMRSFLRLHEVSPGFNPGNALTFHVSLPPDRYPGSTERVQFHDRLRERLEALPGVVSAGAISFVPFGGGLSLGPYAYDAETEQNWESVSADSRRITLGYFETAGMRLRSGRIFDLRDAEDGPRVVIVDEVLAEKAWPGEEAVGKQVMLPVFGPEGVRREWIEVVGVVEHVRLHGLAGETREQVFHPFRQATSRGMDVMVRVERDPADFMALARETLHAMDPELPFHNPRPMSDYVSGAMAQQRFTLVLGSIFGTTALFLATIALYGLVSFTVSQRTHELGVRMALGARASTIQRLVLRQGFRLVLAGLAVGAPAAFLAARGLENLLFGVTASDPLTFLGVPVFLSSVALAACYFPARRATRLDPVLALRSE